MGGSLRPLAERAVPVHAGDHACIDLVNSRFSDHLGRGGAKDRLGDALWREWFLDRFAIAPSPPGPAPMTELSRLRRDLSGVLDSWRAGEPVDGRSVKVLDGWVSGSAVRRRIRVDDDGIGLTTEPLVADWRSTLAEIAASAVELMSKGDPRRLKRCGNPHCSWMYYDHTLNGSKQFCSTNPCGTLIRVRRYRASGR